jgi:hypothetical protein
MMVPDIESLFEDAERDPLLMAGRSVDAPFCPTKGYITFPLSWLVRVLPVVGTPEQLVVALLLYRECLVRRSNTVALPNDKLRKLGIGRYTKYRALGRLQEAGAVAVGTRNGRSVRVTLFWFP